jgi:hypothetical protein
MDQNQTQLAKTTQNLAKSYEKAKFAFVLVILL